jgi:putative flippase GtrA
LQSRFLRFGISGILNTLLSYLVFLIVFWQSESAILSLVLGAVVGISTSFTLNSRWVWKSRLKSSFRRFVLLQISIIVLNWIILHLVSLTSFPREIAQFFLYGIFAVAQYKINRDYVFRKRP